MRAGLASPTKIEAWDDTMVRDISRMMRAPVCEGFSTTIGADEAAGSTMSSRTSHGLMTDDPKTKITEDMGMVTNDFSRSAKTAERVGREGEREGGGQMRQKPRYSAAVIRRTKLL
jgi:hypothetical protein